MDKDMGGLREREPKLGALKQEKFVLLMFCCLEVQIQDVDRVLLSLKAPCGNLFLAFLLVSGVANRSGLASLCL